MTEIFINDDDNDHKNNIRRFDYFLIGLSNSTSYRMLKVP